jgi:hypothetical protein
VRQMTDAMEDLRAQRMNGEGRATNGTTADRRSG